MSIYGSTLVPFHIGSMFCFLASVRSIWHCVGDNRFGSSLTCVLFQLQIFLSAVKQQASTGITSLVNWLGSSTATKDQARVFIASCGAVG